jgi:hypothetical protein
MQGNNRVTGVDVNAVVIEFIIKLPKMMPEHRGHVGFYGRPHFVVTVGFGKDFKIAIKLRVVPDKNIGCILKMGKF